jgi:3-oxoadipate enol-lactonase
MGAWRDDGFVKVNGRRLHYLEAGAGAPLLMLHTGGASAYEFKHVIEPLAKQWRVIAWDMPGHGDSEPLLGHHTIEDYRDILIGFADALGMARFSLAGASIGGYIAMALAAFAPERLERCVIVEAPLRSPQWYKDNWAMFEAMCAIPDTPFEALKARFRAPTPELHERWNIDRHKAGWSIIDLAWAAREFDAAAALTAGKGVRTDVIFGATGPTVGEKQRWAELRPDAPQIVMADCGHFPMIDDPEAFARALAG